ncbi:hypothetical protein NECAME_01198 [Necator americanus]|uniref:C-type lectin domain-containing protein n=1 Tax=Necator americanus TaxID=51031 RepID=W2U101_NECAM|nr:hypothetical protein NECAME_01198 [Necator americanus]ETN87041.1 hypothetical protein NECAME_01198 [Necator americanus]
MVSPRLLGYLICAIFAGTIAVFVHAQEEEGWVTFDGNQYGFFDHEATFDEAEEICVQYGGHLVSIHSQAENDFVHCKCCNRAYKMQLIRFEQIGVLHK